MEVEKISIVLVCDDFYAILLAAFLKSVELNHLSEEEVDVYIVDDNINRYNKAKIIKSLDSNRLKLKWIKMEDAIPKGTILPFLNNAYPINILIRLLIPYFIPKTIKKVIYFDVDMIMLDDISNLWKIDIGECVAGATEDSLGEKPNYIKNGIENYKELGLDGNKPYLNSGMLIINSEKWLQNNIAQKAIDVIKTNKKYAKLSDQYALNIVLFDKWFKIDRKWNCFSISTSTNPSLVHYFYRKPIYKEYSYNYKEEFYYYLNLTEWKNFKPIGKSGHYLKKVKNTYQKLKIFFKV